MIRFKLAKMFLRMTSSTSMVDITRGGSKKGRTTENVNKFCSEHYSTTTPQILFKLDTDDPRSAFLVGITSSRPIKVTD